ncbi:MAG TPA: hypothetical protein VFV18_00215 [Porticoccaceae bacterium]|nr:hypothetical protein [Porticoccaceae bacterium]
MDEKGKEDQKYTGPERRHKQRRNTADRREEIRFEPDREDRRQKNGRRKTDQQFWNK